MSEGTGYKRLYRSRNERVIAGVCGGIAEYFGVDPVVVRILAIFAIFSGVGVLAYIAAIFIVPEKTGETVFSKQEEEKKPAEPVPNNVGLIIGALFVFFGMIFLLNRLGILDHGWFHFSFFPWRLFWPAVLIIAGVVMLTNSNLVNKAKHDVNGWVRNSKWSKSRNDKALTGVSGGLGKAFNIDSGIVRLLWVISTVMTGGFMLLVYIALAFILPYEDEVVLDAEVVENGSPENGKS